MVLVLNPKVSKSPLTLPPSFLHVTLTTPYRSTKAITRLARFIAECKGLVVPEGDFGSDVEGTKPIVFDIGTDERKMALALEECHKRLGDNATILIDNRMNPGQIKKWMKEAGAYWDCYDGCKYCGWEFEKVITVAGGVHVTELITRAKTVLCILLVKDEVGSYPTYKDYFQRAATQGLVEMK